ncbi:hypothetical protein PAXRUDRAFT_141458 [Paxillus rubicundulus Ve08.2h10]|uniref:Uncharacterized protein n=1 Tax=Paxillus rubicundulus Ve08.2h10 TaxID=930991 RepID=A0A0D0DQY8_9AGAM|nr:hypothetical protein PAXRUDRAFT_141458 [Paxillus rubicundulus Ve08.2h10]
MSPTTTVTLAKSLELHPQKPSSKLVNRSQDDPQAKQEPIQTVSRRPPILSKQTSVQEQVYTQKVPHRSSKPIINWFQRKLAGTVRARRIPDGNTPNGQQNAISSGKSRVGITAAPASRANGRSVSSSWPQPTPASAQRQGSNKHRRGVPPATSQWRTISLNDVDTENNVFLHSDDEDNADASTHGSSLARDSMWSPASALEADEDASLRPIPPSAPPSPSLSHSSSSYLSQSRTFRSMAASTKPTTVLSIDLPPPGIGHIAQVPVTPISYVAPRHAPHARSSSTGTNGGLVGSGASITFSALPSSLQPPTRSPPSIAYANLGSSSLGSLGSNIHGLQAPLHTAHHPRNNPRPSSPPLDNASMLTLASSAYAVPGARMAIGSLGSATLSGLVGGGDSISHLGGSVLGDPEGETLSQFLLGDDDRLDAYGERDADASLRALRPRSSRRGSWESEVSGWSARILGTGAGLSTRSKSLWTSNSMKTGGPLSLEDGDDDRENEGVDVVEGGAGTKLPLELEDRIVSVPDGENNDQSQVGSEGDGTRVVSEDVSSTLGRSTGASVWRASSTAQETHK